MPSRSTAIACSHSCGIGRRSAPSAARSSDIRRTGWGWTRRRSEAFGLRPQSLLDSIRSADPARPGAIEPPIYFHLVVRCARALITIAGLAGLAFVLSSCDVGGLSPIFPDPVSPNGKDIYDTYAGISVVAIAVFLALELPLLWVVLRSRRPRL